MGSCSGVGDCSGEGTCDDEVFGYRYDDRYRKEDFIGEGFGYSADRGCERGSGSGDWIGRYGGGYSDASGYGDGVAEGGGFSDGSGEGNRSEGSIMIGWVRGHENDEVV